ncbi:MAG: hypothetical protein Q4Q53_05315 [Methanocorpusculum sp.]|nr:hypothetical protein [Methanocorpusculum sp.]
MDSGVITAIVGLIILIVVCMIIAFTAAKLEARLKNKRNVSDVTAQNSPQFVEGRIYQMEDGSFAKYVGNGKFKKVKEMD